MHVTRVRPDFTRLLGPLHPNSEPLPRPDLHAELEPQGTSLEQIRNLCSILEAKFTYFHAGPKAWKQAELEWGPLHFETILAAVLKTLPLERDHVPTIQQITRTARFSEYR